MELEKRNVIKFFIDGRMPGLEIVSRLRNHYGEKTVPRTQVYSWINEVMQGRTDFDTIASPGRELDEGLATAIAGKFSADPHSHRESSHNL
jgi:hypothetical protein